MVRSNNYRLKGVVDYLDEALGTGETMELIKLVEMRSALVGQAKSIKSVMVKDNKDSLILK